MLQKNRPKELHTTLHKRRYQTTLINKEFELAEKVPQKKKYETRKNITAKKPSIRHNLQRKQPRTIHRNNKRSKRT